MKNFLKNKRVFLSLLAGLLLTVIALGTGTWSWFTSIATSTGNNFTTATVLFGSGAPAVDVWNADPVIASVNLQQNFEGPSALVTNDAAFQTWLTTAPNRTDLFAAWIVPCDNDKVTPGSVVDASGTFTIDVNTNIGVYFRVEAATAASGSGVSLDMLQAISIEVNSIPLVLGTDYVLGDDNYIYILNPIDGGDTVEVGIVAYILGEANADVDSSGTSTGLQDATFSFGGAGAEIIQATNNAAYFYWNDPQSGGSSIFY